MADLTRQQLWSSVPPDVRALARRLDEGEANIAEDAYPMSSAGVVLDMLRDAQVIILGGDFYEVTGDQARPTGMNWHFDGSDFAASIAEAERTLQQGWVHADWFVTFVWR